MMHGCISEICMALTAQFGIWLKVLNCDGCRYATAPHVPDSVQVEVGSQLGCVQQMHAVNRFLVIMSDYVAEHHIHDVKFVHSQHC